MALETRNGRGTYYTRSRRVGGRVVREYLGSGYAAVLMAQYDEMQRDRREWETAQWQHERERLDKLEAMLDNYYQAVERTLRNELQAAGYHQHHRGEWRRKRGKR